MACSTRSAPQGSLRPASQAAASTRWSWCSGGPMHFLTSPNSQVHTKHSLESYPRPAFSAAQMIGTLTPAAHPGVKAGCACRPQCCSVALHYPRRAHSTGSSPYRISSQLLFAACNSCRYRPATYRSKRSYAIIGSMSP
jgi:hypothetical protein